MEPRARTRIFRPVAGSTALKKQLQWGRPFEGGMPLVVRGWVIGHLLD